MPAIRVSGIWPHGSRGLNRVHRIVGRVVPSGGPRRGAFPVAVPCRDAHESGGGMNHRAQAESGDKHRQRSGARKPPRERVTQAGLRPSTAMSRDYGCASEKARRGLFWGEQEDNSREEDFPELWDVEEDLDG